MSEHSYPANISNARRSEDVETAASPLVPSPETLASPSWDEATARAHHRGELELGGRESHYDDDSSFDSSKRSKDSDSLLSEEREPLVSRSPKPSDVVDEDEAPPPPPVVEKKRPVSWMELPKKGQLTILTLARLSEPLAQTSLQSYMFYQLKSFKLSDGSSPSDEAVARQAGILAAAFTGAQFMTAIMWGRMSDWDSMGRKRVILIGLLGTAIGALGFGFSQSFPVAVFWRCVAGLLNGNIGVMRTMISEIIREKKYQSRAFLLLPMTFNVGVIIGPLIGGLLANPADQYPGVFGPDGSLGAKWLRDWPYALPNVVNAIFLLISATALAFGLEETLYSLRDKPDIGLRITRLVSRTIFGRKEKQTYVQLSEDVGNEDVESSAPLKKKEPTIQRKLPFRRIWTANVLFVLLSHGLLACHVGTFNSLWFIFLSTPRYDPDASQHSMRSAEASIGHDEPVRVPEGYRPHFPFTFTGGLALPPASIGSALAILGVIGISLQLLLYPKLSFKLGTVRSLRLSLLLFPLSYTLTPFLATVPSSNPPPGEAKGFLVWCGISLILSIQTLARTFALPASAIIVNNSSPHPSILGTLHGIAQSVSSATRTLGPVLGGYLYSVGLQHGIVGIGWWSLSCIAVVGAIAGQFVRNGSGHEIFLEGEDEDDE